MNTLYDRESLEIMRCADESSDMSMNRIQSIRNFALSAKYQRIGIAHCIMFSTETEIIREYLSRDFEVFTVDCKYGRLLKQELFGGTSRAVLCNPAGQAQYLNENSTDLNISVGLCIGHDMIFSEKSAAPVTSLFTKDFTNNNNVAQAVTEISRGL
ncbi:DUF1847 domain-containing protein [Pontiellaceae bacterium B1224]|nr:DUF1847 domain-containing protein [Pontiellaceae bacterium B1224]